LRLRSRAPRVGVVMRSSCCPWRSAYRGEALALGSSQLERDARIVQGVRADHIVMNCRDVEATASWYERALGFEPGGLPESS
jgi:hypothetical protein